MSSGTTACARLASTASASEAVSYVTSDRAHLTIRWQLAAAGRQASEAGRCGWRLTFVTLAVDTVRPNAYPADALTRWRDDERAPGSGVATVPTIFISYRRRDTGNTAGRLSDNLKLRFGPQSVFFDVERIGAGVNF